MIKWFQIRYLAVSKNRNTGENGLAEKSFPLFLCRINMHK
jgi:hypothetical protein